MAALLYDRPVSDHEYVQRVRRQRPSTLLPVIAAASAHWHDDTWLASPYGKYTPWALTDVARVSLAYGNEHRGDGSWSEDDLLRMIAAYASLTDIMIRDNGSFDSVSGWLQRVSGEQLTYQESVHRNLARTAALFDQTTPARVPKCLVDGWAEELLGCSLSDYVGITQLLQVAALRNADRFDPGWLDQSQMEQICTVIPGETIRQVAARHFVTDQNTFKAENEERRLSRDPHLRRFEYNPLRGSPSCPAWGLVTSLPQCTSLPPREARWACTTWEWPTSETGSRRNSAISSSST